MLRAQSEATGRVDCDGGQQLAGRPGPNMARGPSTSGLDSVDPSRRPNRWRQTNPQHHGTHCACWHERLGIIDNAHKKPHRPYLPGDPRCATCWPNKQSRPARSARRGWKPSSRTGMPKGSYEFQGSRSPTGKAAGLRGVSARISARLCIDAKFPLEAMTALHGTRATDEEKKFATQRPARVDGDEACRRHRRKNI